jgi:alpha-amylase
LLPTKFLLPTNYGLASDIKNGNILHCLNWPLSDIKAEIPNIAAAGFTAVQTSPIQAHDGTPNWYWLYQPTNFWPGNDIGSEQDLKDLCAEAERYGVKVIVDVVANHFAGNHSNIPDELKGGEYYHNSGFGTSDGQQGVDWGNRWQVTHCDIGMPDLNSEHSLVQQYVRRYVDQLKADGVDGIRWDAAKHIALPSEGCGFWPAVTEGTGMYHYGEILDSPGGDGASVMKEYTKYMSVTDNQYSNNTRYAFQGSHPMDGFGQWTAQGVPASGIVYWAESHDTYYNGMESQQANTYIINKAYAAIACRNGSQALYMSRQGSNNNHGSARYGVKGETGAAFSKEVAAVNHFRNAMGTKADYYSNSNNCAVITRQGGGAVIVKGDGNGHVDVVNGGGYAAPGTYKDEISGNTFTITESNISGDIGDTGIAVIYDSSSVVIDTNVDTSGQDTSTTSNPNTDTGTVVQGGSVNIYFDNSAYNWSNVYCYIYTDTGENAKWPGVKLEKDSATGLYKYNADAFKNGNAMFSDGNNDASKRYPADQQPGLPIGGKSKVFGSGNSWNDTDDSKQTTTEPEKPSEKDSSTDTVTSTEVSVLMGDVNGDNKVSLRDASLVLKAAVKKSQLSGTAFAAGDVDSNSQITAADSLAIQRYDIGYPHDVIGKTVKKAV